MPPTLRTAVLLFALALAKGAAAGDSQVFLPPVGNAPYAVGCSSVEQDFTRTGGQSPEAWWQGQPGPAGASRYLTDLLSTPATTVLPVALSADTRLFDVYASSVVAVGVVTCYPTDAGNPYADYPLPTGAVVPHMQRAGQPPIVSVDKARWPVLAYSHGFGGSPLATVDLAMIVRLAGQGYIVVAPFHGDPRFFGAPIASETDIYAAPAAQGKFTATQAVRPVALVRALDVVLAQPGFAERADAGAIGGFGAGLGAESLMLQAGARLNRVVGPGLLEVVSDARLKAIVALTPYFGDGWYYPFETDLEGAQRMRPLPMLAMSVFNGEAYKLFTELSQSRILVVFDGNGPDAYAQMINATLAWAFPFLAAHVLDDRIERARIQRTRRSAFSADDKRWIDYTAPASELPGERHRRRVPSRGAAPLFLHGGPGGGRHARPRLGRAGLGTHGIRVQGLGPRRRPRLLVLPVPHDRSQRLFAFLLDQRRRVRQSC